MGVEDRDMDKAKMIIACEEGFSDKTKKGDKVQYKTPILFQHLVIKTKKVDKLPRVLNIPDALCLPA
jgi:hypothetical protein